MAKKMKKQKLADLSRAVHEIENDGLLHWALHRVDLGALGWCSHEFINNVESIRKANREIMNELVKTADENGVEHCLE